ncbi:MAG: lysoplasmalogenase [Myxococcota bacterium]|jgi:uncharacterized membrane protein YhhN|nr:lysoplasmalogenase [Myxococcota bacterium]
MNSIHPAIPATVTVLGLAGLLIANHRGSKRGKWCTKPVAAAGFIAVALVVGALDSSYGSWILAGLVLSFFGDVFLIPDDRPASFKAGLVSFLLGHVAYAIAFTRLAGDTSVAIVAGLVCTGAAGIVLRWLWPHLGADMRIPVVAYVVVISTMLVLATSSGVAEVRPDIFVGAFLFYLSDLSVARDRFVAPGFWNGAWGLPAYFGGQLVLAWGSGG